MQNDARNLTAEEKLLKLSALNISMRAAINTLAVAQKELYEVFQQKPLDSDKVKVLSVQHRDALIGVIRFADPHLFEKEATDEPGNRNNLQPSAN